MTTGRSWEEGRVAGTLSPAPRGTVHPLWTGLQPGW